MILTAEDIIRKEGPIKIRELGGSFTLGYAKVSMHQPTGVVFIQQNKDNKFDRFIVGVITDTEELDEKKDFKENTEQDFFNACNYFEELVEKRMPKEEEKQPSVGKFYFYKKKLNTLSKVILDGNPNEIIVQEMDIPLVFTPPQKKPYGRLDMTAVNKTEYEIISSKFALKYNTEESEKEAARLNAELTDLAVYDMTPYSNSDDQTQQQEQPQDVNENQLDPNDIEGEDLDDKKQKEQDKQQKEKQKSQKEPKKDKSEKKDKGEKQDDKQKNEEKGEDQGEDQGEEQQGDKGDKGEQQDEGDGQSKEKGDKGEQNEQQDESSDKQTEEEDNESQETSDETTGEGRTTNQEDKINKDRGNNKQQEQVEEELQQEITETQEEKEQRLQKQAKEEQEELQKQQSKTAEQLEKEEEERQQIEEEERLLREQEEKEEQELKQRLNKEKEHLSKNIVTQELVEGLEKMFNAQSGLKDFFKKQERLTSFMQSYSEQNLKKGIYKQLGVPEDFPKKEFIELVKEKTKTIFN